jgi:hypothetical protein
MTLRTWTTALKNIGLQESVESNFKFKYWGHVSKTHWDISLVFNNDEVLIVNIEYYESESFMNGKSYSTRKFLTSGEFIKKFYPHFRQAKLDQLLKN